MIRGMHPLTRVGTDTASATYVQGNMSGVSRTGAETRSGNPWRLDVRPGFAAYCSLFTVLTLLLLAGTAWGQVTVTSTGSGNWDAAIWSGGTPAGNDVIIAAGHTVTITGTVARSVNSLTITGTLTHAANTTAEANKINLSISNNLTIVTGGKINADGLGYNAGTGPGAGNNGNRPGGGYGGMGGVRNAANTPATTYGSITNPVNIGSGGGNSKGAGAVILVVGGATTINNTSTTRGSEAISAVGATAGQDGSGSGGTIYLNTGSITGSGMFNADGGINSNNDGGAGGGGRIALVIGSGGMPGGLQTTARGGWTPVSGPTRGRGGAGTIYIKTNPAGNGDLKVDNGGVLSRGAVYTLVKDYTYQFDSVTTSGQGILALGDGAVLNVSGCTFTMGSRLIVTGTGQLGWTGSYTLGFTVSQQGQGTWVIPGDLVVGSGGLLQHETGTANWLKLDLGNNNLTIDTGGSINVQGLGYANGGGPYTGNGNRYGGVHGGEGGWGDSGAKIPTTPTYGSVTNPVTHGGGSSNQRGGGVAILNAVGDLTINTSILAGGNSGQGSGGAGGSVNISAARLLGGGSISVNGGDGVANNGGGGGGGGRIAVVLSGAAAPIGFTMSANGGARPGANMARGGAGTIYLQGTDSPDGKGLLRISNNQAASESVSTLISSVMADPIVGDVEVLGTANFSIDVARTLAVYGNWSNAVSGLTLGGTGVVEFAGTATRTISGSTTFRNFKCVEPGKTLRFQDGTTQTITTGLTLTGALGNLLALECASSTLTWNIDVDAPATQWDVSYLSVSNSIATDSPIIATDSEDKGGNVNWIFSNPSHITWDGSESTDWSDGDNWDLGRIPLAGDLSITIPSGPANQPVLDVATTYDYDGYLVLHGSLDLNGNDLTIAGAVTNDGALTATGSETLTFESTVDFTGATFTPATSKLILNAAAAGTQAFKPAGNTFNRIEVPNAITLNIQGGGFTANTLYCRAAGAQLSFNAGSTYAVTDLLDLRGTSGNEVVLRSSSTLTQWNLNLTGQQAVQYVDAQDSDADGGKTIYPVDSINTGSNNDNWNFADGKMWLGGTSDWGAGGNWSGGTVPISSSQVFIDETGFDPTLAGAASIAGLTINGFAAPVILTVNMASGGGQSLTVSGDAYIGNNATVTHSAGTTYRVDMNVGSNLTVAAGSSINVQGRGYQPAGGRSGGRHGGEGGWGDDAIGTPNTPTYGSITNPITPGMGSQRNAGGGVVVIQGSGAVTVNAGGQINAAGAGGTQNGGGAGGSVNIKASQLLGTGSITVDGAAGSGIENGGGGGGGRIAVVLSGAAAPVSFAMSANGGSSPGYPVHANGGAGTIYLVGTDSPGGMGLLRISNNQTASASVSTLISANPDMTDTSVGNVELLDQAKLVIDSTRTLSVYGSWSNAAGATAISGGTVVFAGTSPNPVSVWGDNTWSNLTIATAGKTVYFEHSKTQTVYGLPTFDNLVTLKSTSDNTWWWLTKGSPGGTQNVGRVNVQDSNASSGWTFAPTVGSSDLGNNDNWIFPPQPGTMFLLR